MTFDLEDSGNPAERTFLKIQLVSFIVCPNNHFYHEKSFPSKFWHLDLRAWYKNKKPNSKKNQILILFREKKMRKFFLTNFRHKGGPFPQTMLNFFSYDSIICKRKPLLSCYEIWSFKNYLEWFGVKKAFFRWSPSKIEKLLFFTIFEGILIKKYSFYMKYQYRFWKLVVQALINAFNIFFGKLVVKGFVV